MRLLFSEFLPNYSEYAFPYQVWAVEDNAEERESLLKQGFLPSRMKIGLWYLARSSRIQLDLFNENSENRRVRKNTGDYHFSIISSDQFELGSHLSWVKEMVDTRIGEGHFSDSALKRMFSEYMCDQVFVWEHAESNQPMGLIPVMISGKSLFYWMAFYKQDQHASGLGSRMMLEVIDWAKQNDYKHAYLGTVYTESSLYKTNFDGFEFFNGMEWRTNIDELKYLLSRTSDTELLKDPEYLQTFYDTTELTFIQHLQ